MKTVVQHVLSRLNDIGVEHVFGVPGDFAFSVNDAIVAHPEIQWIGCSNELNAAYAADGYARVAGVGAICTTFGVGELSANAGVAGSYAEKLPIFHLVGMPSVATQASGALVHHTLGDGNFDVFRQMADAIVCASAVMTPENVVAETERLIAAALYHRRPVYMAFPSDLADKPALDLRSQIPTSASDPAMLTAAVSGIIAGLKAAKTACVLPGILCARLALERTMTEVIEATNLPFATMFGDKAVLDEQHPSYIGMYAGRMMNEDVRAFVESRDCVLMVGTEMNDFNTAAFTSRLNPQCLITISHHETKIDGRVFPSVEIEDLLHELARKAPRFADQPHPAVRKAVVPLPSGGVIKAGFFYPRFESFLRDGDIVVAEAGTVSMGMAFAHLPKGAAFLNQTLWNAIGWATPAAFGAAIAAPDRRVVLFTGEGSHQLTAQEVGQFARYGRRPVIFILNNGGYLIERLLCREPQIEYNDLAQWHYAELPRALGCDDWHTVRVETEQDLDKELGAIGSSNTASYVEIVTPPDEASPFALKIHENIASLYGSGVEQHA
ncbi:alpha-keto acid decarboxylase family protein [Acidiphilium sp. JA12-A1]|uniref:alpha-keto acid decarboxylase family protein n=1 Tax=Acidiphilium sp. JA12-A1 TaxID=1464546 RepID=UPI000460D120|nr:thiamine pyrophosphate-binding protein [Acidiphilium sp. JA12-A1]KDM66083.1 indole-3-pyruvate decarboxylase IpdC [Acidiphilium sp. JA12-A1]